MEGEERNTFSPAEERPAAAAAAAYEFGRCTEGCCREGWEEEEEGAREAQTRMTMPVTPAAAVGREGGEGGRGGSRVRGREKAVGRGRRRVMRRGEERARVSVKPILLYLLHSSIVPSLAPCSNTSVSFRTCDFGVRR